MFPRFLNSINLARFLPFMPKHDTTPHVSETFIPKPHCIRHPGRAAATMQIATVNLNDGGPEITVMGFYLCRECASHCDIRVWAKPLCLPPIAPLDPLNPDFPLSAAVPENPYGTHTEEGQAP